MQKRNRNGTLIVTRFEFVNYITSKSFIITTLISVFTIGFLIFLPTFIDLFHKLSGPDTDHKEVYIMDKTGYFNDVALFDNLLEDKIIKTIDKSSDELKTFVRNPDVSGVFVIESENKYTWYANRLEYNNRPEKILAEATSNYFRQVKLESIGLAKTEVENLLSEPDLEIVELVEESGKSHHQTFAYTVFLIFLLYMFILSYGQMTATSVASEKSNRAMELLITSASPYSLINGKVFGAGLAGIFQMLLFGWAYYFFFTISKILTIKLDYPEMATFFAIHGMPVKTFLMTVFIFIISYFSYAYLFAALGSLVNRSEEVSQVITPISSLIIVIFMAAIFASYQPDKLWVTIASFVPLVGTLVYFVRFSMLGMPVWESIIILAIHLGTVALTAVLAVKIYRTGILRYGKPPKPKELMKIIKKESK